jgi:cellulose synthase/poly-beta-1,6-N-acetylglucosamine synthase-like glycosyltransferase
MIIKNELEDKIKFKVNNSKYITLNQNEEYNCDVSGEVKIELINPSILNIETFLKILFLMPIFFIVYLEAQRISEDSIYYSFIYKFNSDNNLESIIIYKNNGLYIVRKNNHYLKMYSHSRLKTLLLWIFFFAYSFLIYSLIIIIIIKVLKIR